MSKNSDVPHEILAAMHVLSSAMQANKSGANEKLVTQALADLAKIRADLMKWESPKYFCFTRALLQIGIRCPPIQIAGPVDIEEQAGENDLTFVLYAGKIPTAKYGKGRKVVALYCNRMLTHVYRAEILKVPIQSIKLSGEAKYVPALCGSVCVMPALKLEGKFERVFAQTSPLPTWVEWLVSEVLRDNSMLGIKPTNLQLLANRLRGVVSLYSEHHRLNYCSAGFDLFDEWDFVPYLRLEISPDGEMLANFDMVDAAFFESFEFEDEFVRPTHTNCVTDAISKVIGDKRFSAIADLFTEHYTTVEDLMEISRRLKVAIQLNHHGKPLFALNNVGGPADHSLNLEAEFNIQDDTLDHCTNCSLTTNHEKYFWPPHEAKRAFNVRLAKKGDDKSKPPTPKQIANRRKNVDFFLNKIDERGDPTIKEQLAAMREQLKTLRGNKDFFAQNFAASDWSLAHLIERMDGQPVPLKTFNECAELMRGLMSGTAGHPKRFGNDTTVMKVACNGILSLSALTAGNAVVIVTPTLASYKGALVFQVNPTTTAATIIGYIAPDRDVEELSRGCAVLSTRLSVSAPLVIGGTTTVIGQATGEMGDSYVCPLAAIPGKLAALCVSRKADHFIVGAESHSLLALTADYPAATVWRTSPTDEQNSAIVKVRNSASAQTQGCLRQVQPGNTKISIGIPDSAAASTAVGFAGNMSLYQTCTSGTTTVFWNFNLSTDFLQHLWFGHFTANIEMNVVELFGDRTNIVLEFKVFYSDGTNQAVTAQAYTVADPNSKTSVSLNVNSMGQTGFGAKTGLYITNITLAATPAGGTTGDARVSSPSIDIEFHEVSMQTRYASAILSGVVSAGKINVAQEVQVELQPDPTSIAGKYVTPTADLPYMTEHWPSFVHMMEHGISAVPLTSRDSDFNSSFFKKLAKVGKVAWDVAGKPLAKMGIKAGASYLAGPAGGKLVDDVMDGRHNDRIAGMYNSASFGDNAASTSRTGISFPAVRDDGPTYTVGTFDVIRGSGPCPDLMDSFDVTLTASDQRFKGRSCELAFLLAALKELNWPIVERRDGLNVSGQVSNLSFYRDQLRFLVEPVDEVDIKSEGSNDLFAFMPGHMVHRGKIVEPKLSMFFGPTVTGTISEVPSDYPGGVAWQFEIVKS